MANEPLPSPAPDPARPPPVRSHRSWPGTLLTIVGPALLLVLAVAIATVWTLTTAPGLRMLAGAASALVPGLSIRGIEGTLSSGWRISDFELRTATWSLGIDGLAVEPRLWRPLEPRVELNRLSARRVRIDWAPSDAPAAEPASLGLPFELVIDDAAVDEFSIGARGSKPVVLRRITLAGRMGSQSIDVGRLAFEVERTQVQASGRLAAAPPFATAATARLQTSARDRAIVAEVTAGGSLRALQLQLHADDSAARGEASATLHAFAPVPLERLSIAIDAFDPALWFEQVPSMQLAAQAQLTPTALPAGGWSVAGPFEIVNRAPGPLDRGRLPVRTLRGTLAWDANSFRLDDARAEGVRGRAAGTLLWSKSGGLQVRVSASEIDAATLVSTATSTRLGGQLDYGWHEGVQRFDGNLRNAGALPLSAEVRATIRERVLELQAARVRLGAGRADLRGRLELDAARRMQLQGSFADLDLKLLARGLDTRLNGSVELDGRLQPSLRGRARFALDNSRLAGRPLSGRGELTRAEAQVDADVELRSGTAWLTARGSLGDGRELLLDLAVPDLSALLPGYGGAIDAKATLSGSVEALRLRVTAGAKNLGTPGGQRIANLLIDASGGMAAQEPLAVVAKLSGHSSPGGADASLAGAQLVARGTTSSATIELNGMTATQQPLRMLLAGGVRDGAWRGMLEAAEIGGPLDLLVRKPVPLTLGLAEAAVGPAEFEMRGAQFRDVSFNWAAGRWRSQGRFEQMQPQALDAQARAPRRVVRSGSGDRVPLTLAGRWSLEHDTAINGIAVIERTGGDIYSGIDALNPIGVSDVGAALNVLDNRVTGNVYVRGRALGKIDAEVDAYLDPAAAGGRLLAQQRPFRVVVDANLPDLSWIGPLIGDNIQFGGRGAINAIIGGTPSEPTSTGTLRGDDLRLSWVDQAVRLDNGRLDAALEDGVLVINEWVFAGTPRIAPGDRRALEGLDSGRPFEVRAVGRVALSTLTGSIGVEATQLPVLQREDRWMVVSGKGGITLTPERTELYATMRVDGAFVDFDRQRAGRALPGDVVVRRSSDQRKAAARAPIDVRVALQGELGDRFYIEGAGLEARLAGSIAISGRPAQLRAEGSVRTVDGVFAGYGQRLQIERGIVTFNGPVDNPALNVLAVRSGLPVEVGVAIAGTAQRPLIRLHSNPTMSETEKLNWLVLGRPPGASDGNDRALLSAAASALFAGQADSASAGLLRNLGIDQITLQPGQSSSSLLPRETVAGRLRSGGVSTSSSTAADFLAVGKRINDDLYLSFEQALTGAEYFVALNYRLTRHLSLIARAGSTNALDLVYSIAFD